MAIRNIRTIPDPVLRMKAKPVKEINERIIQLLDDLKETMDLEDGVGIAAPQVGILKQVFVTFVDDNLIEMINPRIVEQSGSVLFLEGCL
ncbi:MAG: peptide deformylase, partial [Defluviitaleaceae bacterium]|nr:peptide deformylase [Defluviitaleaceae bacterium]